MRRRSILRVIFFVLLIASNLTFRGGGRFGFAQSAASPPGQAQVPKVKSKPFYERLFGRQLRVSTDTKTWEVRLDRKEKCSHCPGGEAFVFTAVEKLSGKHYQLRLTNSPDQIDELDVVGQSKLLIFGRISQNAVLVNLIGLPDGKMLDDFMCFDPSLSPDHRFLAYLKYFPSHPGPVSITNEYVVYDLTKSAVGNRVNARKDVVYDAGLPVYPPGATNAAGEFTAPDELSAHVMVSRNMDWLDHTDKVSFVDRWRAATYLVVADVTRGARQPDVVAKRLDTARMVDMGACRKIVSDSDFKRWSKDPASLVSIEDITASHPGGAWVWLVLAPHACLVSTTVKVNVAMK